MRGFLPASTEIYDLGHGRNPLNLANPLNHAGWGSPQLPQVARWEKEKVNRKKSIAKSRVFKKTFITLSAFFRRDVADASRTWFKGRMID